MLIWLAARLDVATSTSTHNATQDSPKHAISYEKQEHLESANSAKAIALSPCVMTEYISHEMISDKDAAASPPGE